MNAKGFTLMEAMIVLVIIGIAAALAVPNMSGWMQRRAINTETRRLSSTLQMAKSEAVTRNTRVYLHLGSNETSQGYALYYNSGGVSGRYRQFAPKIKVDNIKIFSTATSIGFNSRGLSHNTDEVTITVEPFKPANEDVRKNLTKYVKISIGGGISIEP